MFSDIFFYEGDFMSNKSRFISNLNQSTKVTMISCFGFVLLTAVILVIFILFPITPSEKVHASIGRENVVDNNSNGSPQSITPSVVSTASNENGEDDETTTTTYGTTTTRTVKIRITTGSGFLWNGRIPTGVTPNGNTTTTVAADPTVPVPTPNDPNYPNNTTPPVDVGNVSPQPTAPNPDPNGVVTIPVETPVTPPVSPDPTPVVPESPVEGGGNTVESW